MIKKLEVVSKHGIKYRKIYRPFRSNFYEGTPLPQNQNKMGFHIRQSMDHVI